MLAASSAFAYTVNYQFTLAGSTEAITQAQIGGIGSTLDISIWIKSDVPNVTGAATFYGWDTSATGYSPIPNIPPDDYAMGKMAVPLDNKLTGSLGLNIANGWETLSSNFIAGARGSGIRPYGTYVSGNRPISTTTSFTDWTRLFDITLTNIALENDESYLTKIWDYPEEQRPIDTYIVNYFGKYSPAPIYGLNIISQANGNSRVIPEPTTILGFLAFTPALIAAARRKKA